MESIFRKKEIILKDFEVRKSKALNFRKRDSDNGFLRARIYGLNSKLYFSEYTGFTIKELILENFDYFLWLPRKIRNLYYEKEVIEYAEKCLKSLEIIEKHDESLKITKISKTGKIVEQVNKMLDYEFSLAHNESEETINEYKEQIDIEFYKKIKNKPIEKLIRHARYSNSNEIKRKYFKEIS